MDKYEVAQILREIGVILELTDINPNKGLAYRKAAYTVEGISDLKKAVEKKTLESFPGIGKTIAKMISSLVETGSLHYYDELKTKIPSTLLDLAQVPGLSLSRIRFLYEAFKVTSLEELEKTLRSETFVKVKNFGPFIINKLLKKITQINTEGYSLLYPQAVNIAAMMMDILEKYVDKIVMVGALRRKLEVVNQVDLIAQSKNPEECLSIIARHGLVKKVLSKTQTSLSVYLKRGIIVNLFLSKPEKYFFDLVKLTGSETHFMELERQAVTCHYDSFEALFHKKIKNELDVYKRLELPYICPELREGMGEIEAAKKGKLPHLIEDGNLKGTFHCHTIDSDGTNTL